MVASWHEVNLLHMLRTVYKRLVLQSNSESPQHGAVGTLVNPRGDWTLLQGVEVNSELSRLAYRLTEVEAW